MARSPTHSLVQLAARTDTLTQPLNTLNILRAPLFVEHTTVVRTPGHIRLRIHFLVRLCAFNYARILGTLNKKSL